MSRLCRFRRVRRTTAAVLVAGAALWAAAAQPTAGAQQPGPQPAPVTDYATYPAPLPPGCPEGAAALVDVRWANAQGTEVSDLAALTVAPGETVTTTWAAFAAGCVGSDGVPAVAVSMAAYDARAYPFDPAVDQTLLDGWSSCGAGAAPCVQENGRFVLRLVLPTTDVSCTVQFGTILGFPLAVVGPHGSYYSRPLRGDDRPTMLVGAKNYQISPCPPPATTTTAVATTQPPPAVTPTSAAAASTTLPPAVSPTAISVSPELPFTGRPVAPLLVTSVVVLGAGLGLWAATRRRAPSRAGR